MVKAVTRMVRDSHQYWQDIYQDPQESPHDYQDSYLNSHKHDQNSDSDCKDSQQVGQNDKMQPNNVS